MLLCPYQISDANSMTIASGGKNATTFYSETSPAMPYCQESTGYGMGLNMSEQCGTCGEDGDQLEDHKREIT